DPHALALILNNLAMCYYQSFEFQKALDHYDRAAELAVKNNDQQALATLLLNKAMVYEALNDRKQATAILEQARKITHEIGDRSTQGRAIYSPSLLLAQEGNYQGAIKLSNQAIDLVIGLPGQRKFLCQML